MRLTVVSVDSSGDSSLRSGVSADSRSRIGGRMGDAEADAQPTLGGSTQRVEHSEDDLSSGEDVNGPTDADGSLDDSD